MKCLGDGKDLWTIHMSPCNYDIKPSRQNGSNLGKTPAYVPTQGIALLLREKKCFSSSSLSKSIRNLKFIHQKCAVDKQHIVKKGNPNPSISSFRIRFVYHHSKMKECQLLTSFFCSLVSGRATCGPCRYRYG